MIILLFTPRIMTHLFEPEQMGKYYLITTILSFFSLFIINPIGIFVNRNAINWKNQKTLSRRINYLGIKLFPVLIFGFFIIFYLANNFFYFLQISDTLLICLVFVLIFKTNNETFSSVINIINHRKVFVFSQIFTPLLILLFTLFFYNFFDIKIDIWFYSILLSNLFVFIYLYRFVVKLNLNKKVKWSAKNMISFSSPLLISNVFMWFLFEGYRFVLENKVSAFDFGIFVVGFGLATQIISSLDNIYNQYLGPYLTSWMSLKDQESRHLKINEYLVFTFSFFSILLITLIFLSDYIFNILIDKQYGEGIIYFKAGLYFEYLKVLINHLKSIGYSENNNNKTFIGYVFGCLTFLILINLELFEFHFDQILITSAFVTLLSMYLIMNKLIMSYKLIYYLLFISLFFVLDFFKSYQILISSSILSLQILIFIFLNIYAYLSNRNTLMKFLK